MAAAACTISWPKARERRARDADTAAAAARGGGDGAGNAAHRCNDVGINGRCEMLNAGIGVGFVARNAAVK